MTSLVPLEDGPIWEDRWEIEVARRNRAQLWIATLSEPQKSIEQINEIERRASWDTDNPRPPAARVASSDPSVRRIQVYRIPSPV